MFNLGQTSGFVTPDMLSNDYKKWFFDNQLAKKQMLFDKCKSFDNHIRIQTPSTVTSNVTNPATNPVTNPVTNPTYDSITKESYDRTIPPINKNITIISALHSNHTSNHTSNHSSNHTNKDVKIYNRTTNPPIRLYKNPTISLDESKHLPNKSVHLTTRELLQSKNEYDFCSDVPDSPPFNIECLQKLFVTYGGNSDGASYPSTVDYDSMENLGVIKQYFNKLALDIKSSNYQVRKNAMIHLGITSNIIRAPYNQGVEVFWFSEKEFIGRTIEKDFIYNTTNRIFTKMIQLTDVRTTSDCSVRFQVNMDTFVISINKPTISFNDIVNKPGLFSNTKGTSTYSNFKTTPNITKIYNTSNFMFNIQSNNAFTTSLTCEPRAPFLNFEVSDVLEDTRNPEFFPLGLHGLDYHIRSEERHYVPGMKHFVRLNSSNSSIHIPINGWGTVSFAIRLQSMPVKETIFTCSTPTFFCNIIAKPINGSTAGIYISHTLDGKILHTYTPYKLSINKWYLMYIIHADTFNIYCNSIDELISNKGHADVVPIKAPNKISNITIGTKNINALGMYSTSLFNYDIAWIHFFQHNASNDDIYRDCMANWIFT